MVVFCSTENDWKKLKDKTFFFLIPIKTVCYFKFVGVQENFACNRGNRRSLEEDYVQQLTSYGWYDDDDDDDLPRDSKETRSKV